MKFARQEIREHMQGVSAARRRRSARLIAGAGYVIVRSLVNPGVYRAAGLDRDRALAEVRANEHHKSMMRNACGGLMDFLAEAGLLTRPAVALYQRVHMI